MASFDADIANAAKAAQKAALPAGAAAEIPPELAQEAQGMWEMLDSLSKKDPAKYWEFIKEQEQAAETERGYIHPVPDCVLRTSVMEATGAPLPPLPNSPDTSALRQAPRGAKLLINMCSCDRIAPPTLPDGRSVLGHPAHMPYRPPRPSDAPLTPPSDAEIAHYELSLTLHTAVGDARGVRKGQTPTPGAGESSDAVVVDVVFHPWVAQRRAASPALREALLDFVLGTVEDACSVKLERPGKYVAATYRGWAFAPAPAPEAPPLITPWPFWLDAKARKQAEKDVKGGYRPPLCLWSKPKPTVDAEGASTLTTGDVLKAVKGGSKDPDAAAPVAMPGLSAAKTTAAPVIQELGSSAQAVSPAAALPAWCTVSRAGEGGLKVLLDIPHMPAALQGADVAVQCGENSVTLSAGGAQGVSVSLAYAALLSAVGLPPAMVVLRDGVLVKRSSAKGRMVMKLPIQAAA